MDIDTIRSIVTVAAFIAFLAIFVWAYSRGPKRRFEEAARQPFEEDKPPRRGEF